VPSQISLVTPLPLFLSFVLPPRFVFLSIECPYVPFSKHSFAHANNQ
jgi:hypothetical protein